MITVIGVAQLLFFLLCLLLIVKPLGWYIARVYERQPIWGLDFILRPVERLLYRVCGINPDEEMRWTRYASSMLLFNFLGFILLYTLLRLQHLLPMNPQAVKAQPSFSAFNTAVSFITNTDWQSYVGEHDLSYFTQMLGLTAQNFISAAAGMSLLVALVRGIVRSETTTLGNFWVDTVRGIFYILLPLAFIVSLCLVSQGVPQTLRPNQLLATLDNASLSQQVIPLGPVASQTAIAQLGSNGGGFYNANGAHPFENPTPLSNFIECLAILLIPASLCYAYGVMVNDRRQALAILIAMFVLFVPFLVVSLSAEQQGNPLLQRLGVDLSPHALVAPGGNMEGKETRFGIVSSTLWTVATTASSNGSTNSALDSYLPLGNLVSLWMMQLGEVVFGGVGSGLYSLLMLVIITVFIVGLMVGRTPEYLGKKIEPFEMKMAGIAVLVMPLMVLLLTGLAAVTSWGAESIGNPGAHGLTEILYALTSMANNNGSALAGLKADAVFYNVCGGVVMLVGRYWIAIPVLAIAGSLVQKRRTPISSGTLPTYTPLFILLLVCTTLIFGGLSFLPVLSLGPIVEHLMLWGAYVN